MGTPDVGPDAAPDEAVLGTMSIEYKTTCPECGQAYSAMTAVDLETFQRFSNVQANPGLFKCATSLARAAHYEMAHATNSTTLPEFVENVWSIVVSYVHVNVLMLFFTEASASHFADNPIYKTYDAEAIINYIAHLKAPAGCTPADKRALGGLLHSVYANYPDEVVRTRLFAYLKQMVKLARENVLRIACDKMNDRVPFTPSNAGDMTTSPLPPMTVDEIQTIMDG